MYYSICIKCILIKNISSLIKDISDQNKSTDCQRKINWYIEKKNCLSLMLKKNQPIQTVVYMFRHHLRLGVVQ